MAQTGPYERRYENEPSILLYQLPLSDFFVANQIASDWGSGLWVVPLMESSLLIRFAALLNAPLFRRDCCGSGVRLPMRDTQSIALIFTKRLVLRSLWGDR